MMDKLKFALFSVVVLVLLGLITYWSVNSMQSGSEFKTSQKVQQLQEENDNLTEQVADLMDKLDTLEFQVAAAKPVVTQDTDTGTPTSSSTQPATTYKNQTLINELQGLIASNITMKLKSSGTRVGTVQKFLNIYNKTSNKIDNDYGAGTVKAVAAFQKDQGLTADGQAGPTTFSKMISWLKKQG